MEAVATSGIEWRLPAEDISDSEIARWKAMAATFFNTRYKETVFEQRHVRTLTAPNQITLLYVTSSHPLYTENRESSPQFTWKNIAKDNYLQEGQSVLKVQFGTEGEAAAVEAPLNCFVVDLNPDFSLDNPCDEASNYVAILKPKKAQTNKRSAGQLGHQ